jgi:hypothetical protein
MGGGLKQAVKALPVLGPHVTPLRRALANPGAFRRQRANAGVFLLNTMRKSGSHFLMSILANYLWLELLGERGRLDFRSMGEMIWNQRTGAERVALLRDETGYSTWRWEHENPLIRFNNARAIVHTYRNPLDTFVSRFHYLYLNRERGAGTPIEQAIELEVPAFAWHYGAVRAIEHRPNVRRIAYESLVRDPCRVVEELLEFAHLPVAPRTIARAVEASAAHHVVADEQRYGLVGRNLVGGARSSFIRSGEIGEWRSALEAGHVRRIEEILDSEGVSLQEFALE